jgi:hypothetical protein
MVTRPAPHAVEDAAMSSRIDRLLLPAACLALLLAAGALAPAGGVQAQAPAAPAQVEGRALVAAPESRGEAAQSIDAAVAAALIGAISGQFGERKVEVKLDKLQTEPVNLIDLQVNGEGRLRIGADEEWLPIRFGALYDSVAATVAQPRLTVGGTGESAEVSPASPLGRTLTRQASARLQDEFAQQPARLQLDKITRLTAGKRYVRLEGVGAVDFDTQGSSVAVVHALYDSTRDEWLQVGYELGAGMAQAAP